MCVSVTLDRPTDMYILLLHQKVYIYKSLDESGHQVHYNMDAFIIISIGIGMLTVLINTSM